MCFFASVSKGFCIGCSLCSLSPVREEETEVWNWREYIFCHFPPSILCLGKDTLQINCSPSCWATGSKICLSQTFFIFLVYKMYYEENLTHKEANSAPQSLYIYICILKKHHIQSLQSLVATCYYYLRRILADVSIKHSWAIYVMYIYDIYEEPNFQFLSLFSLTAY